MTPEAPPQLPDIPPPTRQAGVSVREVLREGRALFSANAVEITAPLAMVQLPLAVLGAVIPWVLYQTTYSDQQDLFNAQALLDGPRGLLFAFTLVFFVWGMFILVGIGASMVAVSSVRRGSHLRLPEYLDPPFTKLGGLFLLGMTLIGLYVCGLIVSVTVVLPLVVGWVTLRLAAMFYFQLVDNLPPGAAMRASWNLLRGNVVRLLGVVVGSLPIVLGMMFVAFVALIIVSIPFTLAGDSRNVELAASVVGTIVWAMLTVPAMAYLATTTTVFFETLKGRTDARLDARI